MVNRVSLEKHFQIIEHLKERYVLLEKELKILEEIKKYTINCVAFTTEGSFDSDTDEFFPEEITGKYKIRIRYKKRRDKPEKTIYLKVIS
tara:strand:- start:122 stop:391 length:270 start_codon:yes stop_codon:yes gene_type:complete